MTSPEGRRDRAFPVRLQVRREEAGTLLGALAWVLGALEIMSDRGHAEDSEEFHELRDRLAPKIERLIELLNAARNDTMTRPEFEEPLEAAYTEVREAFEQWIELTATDTLAIVAAARVPEGSEAAPHDKDASGTP